MTLRTRQSTQARSSVPTYVIRTRTFRKVWTQGEGILSNVLGTLFVIFQLIGANGGILPFGRIIFFRCGLLLQIQYLIRQKTLILCLYENEFSAKWKRSFYLTFAVVNLLWLEIGNMSTMKETKTEVVEERQKQFLFKKYVQETQNMDHCLM